jgi:lipid II:glycine glycyltransferase (peptidoglycan interpeptide bridge formation enzyme)
MEKTDFIKKIVLTELTACEKAESFLQSALWGQFKSGFGWKAKSFLLDWDSFGERPLLTLSRKLNPLLSFTYIPWGPELPAGFPEDARAQALSELAQKMKVFLPKDSAFVRFDPPWFVEGAAAFNADGLSQAGVPQSPFIQAAANIQAPDTVIVDLSPPVPDILAAMKPKWRYNIGLAEKKGVRVNRPDESGVETFYRLLSETAQRDKIEIHSLAYYKALFAQCRGGAGTSAIARLYTATHENDTLAAIVVLFRAKQATYLYGASSNIKRNFMAPYAVQWRAMQEARAAGCKSYDLFGIPPDDNPYHPMAGLYLFKTGFGGKIIHRPGSWDYPYKALLYKLFRLAESIRKKIRDWKKRG